MNRKVVQLVASKPLTAVDIPFTALGYFHDRLSPQEEGVELAVEGFFRVDGAASSADSSAEALRLYHRLGPSFVRHLRGSFALALWDPGARRLVLATDHFGTRSMYYWAGNGRVAFASRIASLVAHPQVPRCIDENSIYFFLNHSFIPAPATIYREIRRLEPGQCLVWENRRIEIVQYWDMSYPEEKNLDEATAAELLCSSVEEAISFLSGIDIDAPAPGAFLSGGTDSSTVLGLLARRRGEGVRSFSVGFDENPYNEIHYARIAAARFKSRLHESFVRPKEALDELPAIVRAFDEPFGNSSALPTYFCVKAARTAGVTVMFAGDGGDELYGGNERYLTEKIFSLYHCVPRPLGRLFQAGATMLPELYPWRKVKNYVKKANLPSAERFFEYQLYYMNRGREMFTEDLYERLDKSFPLRLPQERFAQAGNAHWLNRLLYVDLKLAISDNDLFKVNRCAEACGLAVRYPYLDKEVASASAKIPAKLKLKGWQKRYIFKKAFASLLPPEILAKKKHGFGLPTGEWLRRDNGFRDLARSLLLDPRSLQRGYFKRQALEDLLRRHDAEASNYYGSHIWNFMMLEMWHRCHFDHHA